MSGPAADEGVGAAIVQVAEDARGYVDAQLALYKAIATVRLRAARTGLIFGAVAGVLALVALIALAIGLILTLTPSTGPFGATAIVVVGLLVVAGVLGKLAATRLGAAFGDIG